MTRATGSQRTEPVTAEETAADQELLNQVLDITQKEMDSCEDMARIVDSTRDLISRGMSAMQESIVMARAMAKLLGLFTDPMLKTINELRETALGYCTDRPPGSDSEKKYGAYKPHQLKIALLEGMLRGARTSNNEINVISGKAYLTRNFFERAVTETPGLSNLNVQLGAVASNERGAVVELVVSYKIRGVTHVHEFLKTDVADLRVPVRMNAGMGTDAAYGKATRKVLARIYGQLSGQTPPEAEQDSESVTDNPGAKEGGTDAPPGELFSSKEPAAT